MSPKQAVIQENGRAGEPVPAARYGVVTAESLNRPAPFRLPDRRTWVVWDDEEAGEFRGFAIYVRENVTVAEREELVRRDAELIEYNARWLSTPPGERTPDKFLFEAGGPVPPRDLEYRLLAPLVLDWNAVGIDLATGEDRPLPPPSVDPDAFGAIYPEQFRWIRTVVVGGYRSGKGVSAWNGRSRPGSATATGTG